eukprot:scaffold5885_cov201-Amphora_coffeaeformis.AAC.20
MDPSDDCVEVIASQFFDESVRLYSIQRGENPSVVWERDIDTHCGAAFASVLTDLDQEKEQKDEQGKGTAAHPEVIDAGSTVPTLKNGDSFSHLLVTSHKSTTSDTSHLDTDRSAIEGGSVFAYRFPTGSPDAWKTEPWLRTTVATGFACKGKLANIINPGAPGFCYTFPARRGDTSRRPLLAVAGDCAESAYVFRPENTQDPNDPDPSTKYKLMVEVECESTVGSIGVGYGDFLGATIGQEQQPPESNDYAKLYIPCFEKNKVLLFALGDGGASQQ